MDSRLLPPESFFAGTPPHVRAYIEQLHATIADLHTRIAELEANQAKNSTNSSLPPSSEHPHAKPARPTPKSLRRCGGQAGHAKHQRPLLPTEQCQRVIPCVPPTKELFALWQKVRDGTLSRPAFVEQMKPIRAEVERLLLRGYFNARVHGFCKGLRKHRQNRWTFVEVEGAEPTNNAAEQALRQAVIWRKLSFGTQSSAGSRFVERLRTVVETCRRQQRNVFSWLVEVVEARFAGKTAPSLLSGV